MEEQRQRFHLRRLSRFSLRTLIVVVTALSIWLGLHVRSVKLQQASMEALKPHASMYYDYEVDTAGRVDPNATSNVPAWLLSLLGRDHFHDVVQVDMDFKKEGNLRPPEILQHLSGFADLRILRLQSIRVTDDGWRVLRRLTNLHELRIWNSEGITDASVAHLSSLTNLQYLFLHSSQLTDEGVSHLANLVQLKTVSLSSKHLTDECMETLSRLPKLENLSLWGTLLGEEGLAYLQDMPQLRSLGVDISESSVRTSFEGQKLNASYILATIEITEASLLVQFRKQPAKAVARYEKALRLHPERAAAHNGLAWVLATYPDAQYRDGDRALEHATKACELSKWKRSYYLGTLAAAYAEVGDFDNAVKWQEKALDGLPVNLTEKFNLMLDLFRSGSAYRQEADDP